MTSKNNSNKSTDITGDTGTEYDSLTAVTNTGTTQRGIDGDSSMIAVYQSIGTSIDTEPCRPTLWHRACRSLWYPLIDQVRLLACNHPWMFWGMASLVLLLISAILVFYGRMDLLRGMWHDIFCWVGFIDCNGDVNEEIPKMVVD